MPTSPPSPPLPPPPPAAAEPPAPTLPESAAAALPASADAACQTEEAVAAPPETLSAKVDRIKKELGLSPELSIGAALGEANAALELQPEGTLNQQAVRLLALIG